jgi:hypothetical protein
MIVTTQAAASAAASERDALLAAQRSANARLQETPAARWLREQNKRHERIGTHVHIHLCFLSGGPGAGKS